MKIEARTIQIHFRVAPSEYEEIKKKAAISGLSISEFARRSLTGEKIVTAPTGDFKTLIWEIKRIGSNLNQLLRKLNILGIAHPLELEHCADDLREITKAMLHTYRPGKGD